MRTFSLLVAALALPLAAQQPNTPGVASLVFAGQDGPVYPTTVNWTSTVIAMDLEGAPGLPYNVYAAGQNGTAGLFPGFVTTAAGIVDLDVSSGLQLLLDGLSPRTIFDRLAIMDPTGNASWTFPIGSSGPIGAFQALVLDPSSAAGATLTAASEVNVSLGQSITITGGDDVGGVIPLFFGTGTTFYGTPYSEIFLSENGNITFGGLDTDPFASLAKFDVGFPRIAPLWTDLLFGATVGGQPLIGTFTETEDGWNFTWTFMRHYTTPGSKAASSTTVSTFGASYFYTGTAAGNPTGNPDAIVLDYATGNTQFNPPIAAALAADYGVIGITPGGTVPAAPADTINSMPLDSAPITFDPTTQPNSASPISIAPNGNLTSYRVAYGAGALPLATFNGTGLQIAFYPLGAGDNYVLY